MVEASHVGDPVGAAPRRKLTNLQVLRFIAAWLVVWFHWSNGGEQEGYNVVAARYGIFGVDLFFVLSGFIMAYTTGGGNARPLAFLARRVARIVPLYWVLTVMIFGVALVMPRLLGATEASLVDLVKSLFFVPFEKSNGLVQPMIFLGWTLNYEIFFYLVFALCCLSSATLVLVTGIFLALTVLGLIVPSGLNVIFDFYTNPIILEFVAGMWIWKILVAGQRDAPSWALGLVLSGFLLLPDATGRPLLALAFMGDISYSTYLVHPYVQKPVMMVGGGLPFWLLSLGMIIAVVLVSMALYFWLEKPGNRILRNLLMPPGR